MTSILGLFFPFPSFSLLHLKRRSGSNFRSGNFFIINWVSNVNWPPLRVSKMARSPKRPSWKTSPAWNRVPWPRSPKYSDWILFHQLSCRNFKSEFRAFLCVCIYCVFRQLSHFFHVPTAKSLPHCLNTIRLPWKSTVEPVFSGAHEKSRGVHLISVDRLIQVPHFNGITKNDAKRHLMPFMTTYYTESRSKKLLCFWRRNMNWKSLERLFLLLLGWFGFQWPVNTG